MPSGEFNVTQDSGIVLDGKARPFIHSAKGASIVRTSAGDLQKDAVGLTGRSEYISLVVHAAVSFVPVVDGMQ